MEKTKDRYADLETAVANRKTARERRDQKARDVKACEEQLEKTRGLLQGAEIDLASAEKQVDAAIRVLKPEAQ